MRNENSRKLASTMLLLFDYDGVIVDSFAPLLALCAAAQRELRLGRAPTPDDFRTGPNLTFDEIGRRIGIPEDRVADYAARIFSRQQTEWNPAPFPDIPATLLQLARRHTLAVVTASRSSSVQASLRSFGLEAAVSRVMGGESGDNKSVRIARAIREFQAALADTCMIGDAVSDIRAGRAAGVHAVAVAWGFQDRALLAREGPDVILDRPAELLTLEHRLKTGAAPAAASGDLAK